MNEADLNFLSNGFGRPINETEADRRHELDDSVAVALAWGCEVRKLSDGLYGADWALLLDEEVKAFAEYKWRGKDRYDSLLIGCAKVWKLMDLGFKSNLPVWLFVRWNDGLWGCALKLVALPDVIHWTGNDRGQNGDKEPCYKLPMSHFKRVCD